MKRILLIGHYNESELCDNLIRDNIKRVFEEVSDEEIEWSKSYEKGKQDLIVLGGGSILSDNVYFNSFYNLVKDSKVPYCIYGTGKREDMKRIKKKLIRIWDDALSIVLRGSTTGREIADLGLNMYRVIIGDPIFLSEKKIVKKEDYIGGVFRPHNTSRKWMKKIFKYLEEQLDYPVKLFSFSNTQKDGFGNESLGYKSYSRGLTETFNAISKSKFWFGNRLHAFCYALAQEVPTIGVEIEFDKVSDICNSIDYGYYVESNILFPMFELCFRVLNKSWDTINTRTQILIHKIKLDLKREAKYIMESI